MTNSPRKKSVSCVTPNVSKVNRKVTPVPDHSNKSVAITTITSEKYFWELPHIDKSNHKDQFGDKKTCLGFIQQYEGTDTGNGTDNSDNYLRLFGEDKTVDNHQRYFPLSYLSIYFFARQRKYHLYEYFEVNDPIKLFIDIDYHVPPTVTANQRNKILD